MRKRKASALLMVLAISLVDRLKKSYKITGKDVLQVACYNISLLLQLRCQLRLVIILERRIRHNHKRNTQT